jgi:hypothetical protein
VENYKKKMRKEIHDFFKSYSTISNFEWADMDKNEKFEELYNNMLAEVQQQCPSNDIPAEVVKVYQNSNVIKNRMIDMKLSEDDSSFLSKLMQERIHVYSSANQNKNINVFDKCLNSVDAIINQIAASQQYYDDSIISNFIYDVDAAITSHSVSTYSEVRKIHIYGQYVIITLMEIIGSEWEAENSVLAKLKRNKENMHEYFMMVSQGAEKIKLFSATLANALKSILMLGNYIIVRNIIIFS